MINQYGEYGWRKVNNTIVYFDKEYWKPEHNNLTEKEKLAISVAWKEYKQEKENDNNNSL